MVEEKSYEKHAWILPFVVGIVALLFGLYFLFVGIPPDARLFRSITGTTWSELVAEEPGATTFIMDLFRVFGMSDLVVGILVMAIASVPFRRGEKWAWQVLWIGPLYLAYLTATNLIWGGGIWPLFAVGLILSLLGQLLPYRKFFPVK